MRKSPNFRSMFASVLALAALLVWGCDGVSPPSGATPSFAPNSSFNSEQAFFDFPFPSDHRLRVSGQVVNDGWPRPFNLQLLDSLIETAKDRKGFSRIPVAWFRFNAALMEMDEEEVIPASPESPLLLVDLSPGRVGTLYPVVARVLEEDEVLPANVLAVAPVPGVVLPVGRYAFVVKRSLNDARGKRLGVPPEFAKLRDGREVAGENIEELLEDYEALFETLEELEIDRDEVSVAAVFTTDDLVEELRQLVETVSRNYDSLEITDLALAESGDHSTYCQLQGTIELPQFQRGTPPFNSQGLFEMEGDRPKEQRRESIPVVITLPKDEMPQGGFPLMLYIHGSGGLSTQVVDRGRIEEVGGEARAGEGPAFVVARHSIATASSAMPVNPERVPKAGETEYLNFSNLAAFRDTFRQGVLEQRLFLDTLLKARISPDALEGCSNPPTLPTRQNEFFFRDRPAAMGQSMGAMYLNLLSAVEDRFGAVVPTGAGGFWTYFIFRTGLIPGAGELIGKMLKVGGEGTFLHPSLHVVQMAWEVVEPLVYASEVSRLNSRAPKHIYQPVGLDDEYFPTDILDAMAMSYGHEQAGAMVWESTQERLQLVGKEGLVSYPIANNLRSAAGQQYTGVVVQFQGDGIYDPHSIAFQRDEVKFQYGCFLKTYFETGVARVLSPSGLYETCEEPGL